MFIVSQLANLATAKRRQIDLSRTLVRCFVHVGDGKGNQIAFGRDLGVADAPHFQKIVDRESAFLRHRERREREQSDRDGKEALQRCTHHCTLE